MKTIEPSSISAGAPTGRVSQSAQESKNTGQQAALEFGFKEVGIVVGIIAIMLATIWYGYARQAPTGIEIQQHAALERSASQVDSAQALPGVAAQSARAEQALPATAVRASLAVEPVPMPVKIDSNHADVYFDFGKSRLNAIATTVLQQQAQTLKDGNWAVLIQGYADQHGPAEYNKRLALRRAESVKQFLVELGVSASSMKVVSLGKDSSICEDQSPACQRLSRRVHLEMVKLERQAAVVPSTMPTTEIMTSTNESHDESVIGSPDIVPQP